MRTALTRWSPTTGDLVRDRFSRLFEDAFNDMLRPFERDTLSNRAWAPPVDIRETDDSLVLLMDLPGLRKEDVQITLENNVLTVSGERKLESEQNNDQFHRMERTYGAFTRSFNLGPTVHSDRVEAHFRDGVLEITLPKVEESKPRRISIK